MDVTRFGPSYQTSITGVLLAKMRNSSWEDRAEAVLALRRCTREAHKDVRSNERVMKTMWNFIENVKTDAPDPYEGWEAPGADDEPVQKKKNPVKKRKRKDDDEAEVKARPNPRTPKSRKSGVKQETTPNGVRFVA